MTRVASHIWKTGRTPRVCVVGAGFAGMTAATRLGQAGLNVTVLEARDRIGGRVYQSNALGHLTDMGANWIHGTHENPIRDIAKRMGLVMVDIDEVTTIYDEKGMLVPVSKVEKYEEILWSLIGQAFKYAQENDNIPESMSLKDFITDRLGSQDIPSDEKRMILQMAGIWGSYIGAPYDRQSLKYLYLEGSLEGENSFLASTYKQILEIVHAEMTQYAVLNYGTRVTSVTTTEKSSAESYPVEINAHLQIPDLPPGVGFSLHCDAVVVTVPFGCLRDGQIAFTPALGRNTQHAIDSITYGNLEKVYLRFPQAFWGSSDQEPVFTQFLHPQYASNNPRSWDIGMVKLSNTSSETGNSSHSTLLFYIYGECGTHVTELIQGLDPSDPSYLARLTNFFKDYYSRLPHYDDNDESCSPIAAIATDWQHDPLAGYGSYTNWQIDDNAAHGKPPKMELDKAIEAIRHGMPERNLWFAGEHTAPFDALGTVTGAYLSGQAAADRVVKSLAAGS